MGVKMLETGIRGSMELTVTKEMTARAMGSGELEVFATPAMVALAEETAWRSVAGQLEDGQGTVGTKLEIEHLSATPVGMKVFCETELISVDRRKLVFRVQIRDEAGSIGCGTHERYVVENGKFFAKAQAKKPLSPE